VYVRTSWTSQAEVLAHTREIGDDIALIAGRCRYTGLDPRSFAPIMGAAMALGSRPWHIMETAYASDSELIGDVLDLDIRLWQHANAYIRLRSNIVQAHAQAGARFAQAAQAEPPDRPMMAYWAAVKGDCEAALEVLAGLAPRLRAARAKLAQAPAQLGDTYLAVYDLLRQGRVMPYDGRFLTGEELPC
jgi:hypothetical protein